MSDQAKKQPVFKLEIRALKAAIWRNETETGPWHNVTFERVYKDGDEWKSSASFGRDDLLELAKLANNAHTWIVEQESAERRHSAERST